MTATLEPQEVRSVVRPLTLVDKEIGFYKREGYLYLPGLIEAADVQRLRREVLDTYACHGFSAERLGRAMGEKDKLHQISEYLAGTATDGLVNSPALRAIAGQLLGGAARLYLPFTAVKNGGGGGRFHFHQDNQYTRYTDGLGGINIWFALVDMTPENGCLQVVPRSHLRGDEERVEVGDGHKTVKIEPDFFLPVRMRAGDAIAFTRLTVHGSGPNTTSEPRLAYAVQFYRDDVEAVWDNQPPRLLREHRRWTCGPVPQISQKIQNLDGH